MFKNQNAQKMITVLAAIVAGACLLMLFNFVWTKVSHMKLSSVYELRKLIDGAFFLVGMGLFLWIDSKIPTPKKYMIYVALIPVGVIVIARLI